MIEVYINRDNVSSSLAFRAGHFHCFNRRIRRNDIPQVIHRDLSGGARRAISPAGGKRDLRSGSIGNRVEQKIVHRCFQSRIAIERGRGFADDLRQQFSVRRVDFINERLHFRIGRD